MEKGVGRRRRSREEVVEKGVGRRRRSREEVVEKKEE